jgi:hypothetical protein
MYKNVFNRYSLTAIALSLFSAKITKAQISVTGQLRPRAEVRDGYGTLEPKGNDAAALISQRTRLTFNYRYSKLIFQATVQDVRLWGQDASTISINDGNRLMLHEAWAEIILSDKKDTSFHHAPFDYFAIKLGRQELSYDDERLLGPTDWIQQGRRHDAMVIKLRQAGWQFDLGAAFNQSTDAIGYNGTYYTPANVPATVKDSKGNLVNTPAGLIPLINATGVSAKNGAPTFANPPSTNGLTQNYKALEYLYIAKKIDQTKVSAIFLTDQFGKYKLDSVKNTAGTDVGYIYGRRYNQPGVNVRYTTGFQLNPVWGSTGQWAANGTFYYQGGHDRDGLSLSAYMWAAYVALNTTNVSYTLGMDYLSGNDALSTSTVNHRFDPLYGTPHKFYGYMDYFYGPTGSATGGLTDPYAKIKYTSDNKRFYTGLEYRYMLLAGEQKDANGKAVDKYLGSEFDVTTGYKLNKFTTAELGLSYLAATGSMEYAKNITPGTARLSPMWAYLQFNIRPDFFSK